MRQIVLAQSEYTGRVQTEPIAMPKQVRRISVAVESEQYTDPATAIDLAIEEYNGSQWRLLAAATGSRGGQTSAKTSQPALPSLEVRLPDPGDNPAAVRAVVNIIGRVRLALALEVE